MRTVKHHAVISNAIQANPSLVVISGPSLGISQRHILISAISTVVGGRVGCAAEKSPSFLLAFLGFLLQTSPNTATTRGQL
ncbi:hypothetical protein B0T17DRAFT_540918 [Bombardia bombarda]|uniref:Uncharacterized protein n=1 Tax=Bombardia bombarda TaxID=252184 RepID=A0AA39WGL8_9PEZI|nr:hypothetical protein B0T17DRAFT_540918 [Bombardia bombarda]